MFDATGGTGHVEIFLLKQRMKRSLRLLGHLIGSKVKNAAQVERLVALLNALICERGYNRFLKLLVSPLVGLVYQDCSSDSLSKYVDVIEWAELESIEHLSWRYDERIALIDIFGGFANEVKD